MRSYEGINEAEWKVIRHALLKLEIKGADAISMAGLLSKVEVELDILNLPIEDRPNPGDIITKE